MLGSYLIILVIFSISSSLQFKCKIIFGIGILLTNIFLTSTTFPPFGFRPRFLCTLGSTLVVSTGFLSI